MEDALSNAVISAVAALPSSVTGPSSVRKTAGIDSAMPRIT